ncbi:MAG: hypothetical protein AAF752_12840 [Bacteroidota bacterium]
MNPNPSSSLSTPAALSHFMAGLIDYAGLFPPARLALPDAVATYARHLGSDHAQIVGPFVIPASRLADLDAHAGVFSTEHPWQFSVLVGRQGGMGDFAERLRTDLERVARFEKNYGDAVRVPALEIRLPADGTPAEALATVRGALEQANAVTIRAYLEPHRDGQWAEAVPALAQALQDDEAVRDPEQPPLAFKLRCGGIEPELFPSVEEVALAIDACRCAGVPFKATAGLHEPVRYDDSQMGVTRHGFFNVFGAGVLAWEHRLVKSEIIAILNERDPNAFRFDNAGFAHGTRAIGLTALDAARTCFAHSFGSCNIDEPMEGLARVGLGLDE